MLLVHGLRLAEIVQPPGKSQLDGLFPAKIVPKPVKKDEKPMKRLFESIEKEVGSSQVRERGPLAPESASPCGKGLSRLFHRSAGLWL